MHGRCGVQSNMLMRLSSLAALAAIAFAPSVPGEDMPIDRAALERLAERSGGRSGLTNLLSFEQVSRAIDERLAISFEHVERLLDGSTIAPAAIYGTAYYGPYPFEAKEVRFPYRRSRRTASVTAGKGSLDVGAFFAPPLNSEGWTDRGEIAVRFELYEERAERDRKLGTYDVAVAFAKTGSGYERRPALAEGPFVNLVRSDDPSRLVISFRTDDELRARVEIRRRDDEESASRVVREEVGARWHEIEIDGLEPATEYLYRVLGGGLESRTLPLRTAPERGQGPVRIGYFGDSRAGVGTGLESFMGVNYDTIQRISHLALIQGADLMLVGGDLVSGYTSVREDFETQLHAWKQAMTGFWNERPVYSAMGNHEALLKIFEGVSVDRYPYATESAEASFARAFVHPRNAPERDDPSRPSYSESVYSLQYGLVKAIAFNNNYWYSGNPEKYGGCPEGYLLEDQLRWIEAELDAAEADPTVRYVLLYAQEPIFPNGGHVGDAMWYGGDNRTRAHIYRDGKVRPEEDGILAVRNRLVRAIARSAKVAAVLGSDEHAYHRVLIGPDVPIGDPERDDRNRNAKIDEEVGETPSPLEDLRHSTWFIVCGGGGAPYYAEEETPWNRYWQKNPRPLHAGLSGFRYTSQENIVFFEADEERISVRVLNRNGEVLDEIPDLMADKG